MAENWALVFLGGCAIGQFVSLAHLGSASNAASSSVKIKGEWLLSLHQTSSVCYILAAAYSSFFLFGIGDSAEDVL